MSEAASVSLSESSQGEETTESGNESTNRNGSVSADSSGANFKEELAGKESRDVFRSKLLVVLVLLAFAVTVSFLPISLSMIKRRRTSEQRYVCGGDQHFALSNST